MPAEAAEAAAEAKVMVGTGGEESRARSEVGEEGEEGGDDDIIHDGTQGGDEEMGDTMNAARAAALGEAIFVLIEGARGTSKSLSSKSTVSEASDTRR